jgi:hypothetical protein
MTLGELGSMIVSIGTLQGLTALWLKGRFEASLKHDYDRKLEELKFEMRQREQAAMIAELLAEWSSNPTDKKRLNQLTWEATLWLPENVARDLCAIFSYQPGAKSVKDILIEVRKLLKGADDGLTAGSIIHFP